ncbi:MAG TPA: F0F1 ATP synthase subunit delta [Candidatus Limnocylindrales bacterium]|nr:F0F1 ATP synthase subunit delta [Candidatus Limnocylindrales bacterium]
MARPTTAARRYAEAAFDLAHDEDSLEGWAADLRLAAGIASDERIERFLDNPAIPLAEREAAIDSALKGRVREPVRKLARILLRRNRGDILPIVCAECDRLLNRERGVVTAHVTSATPLSEADLDVVRERIASMRGGATVQLEQHVDESLIGGLTVRVGDQLIDASVRGRLERLRAQLVAGTRSAGDPTT